MDSNELEVMSQRVWHKETSQLMFWVRIKHIPTGTYAFACELSEIKAKQTAIENLRAVLDKQQDM